MTTQDPNFTPEPEELPDPWHLHTPEEGRPQVEHVAKANPAAIGAAFGLMSLVLVVTVIAVIIYFNSYVTQSRAMRIETTVLAEPWQQYRRDVLGEDGVLNTYGWAPGPEGEPDTVRLPLAVAVERVVEEYSERGR
jgi:hypothetical protein